MVRIFPFWVDDWTFANFYNAVAGSQTCFTSGVYEIKVCPLVAMVMNVVSYLTE